MEKRNVLIRKIDSNYVEKLCIATGTTVGTKAFLIAADYYLQQQQTVSQSGDELKEMNERLVRYSSVIEKITPLCQEMSAICARLSDVVNNS